MSETAAKEELEMIHGQVVEEMRVDLSGELDATPESEAPSAGGQLSSWLSSDSAAAFLPAKTTVAREWISNRRKGLKPWREFFKSDKFGVPAGVPSAVKRLTNNINEFQSNYLCVFIGLFFYCILTSPMLLLALFALVGLVYLVRVKSSDDGTLRLGGKTLNKATQYGLVAAVSFPLFWMAGAGSAIFWVIGASIFLIIVHAAFYGSEAQAGAEFLVESA